MWKVLKEKGGQEAGDFPVSHKLIVGPKAEGGQVTVSGHFFQYNLAS